MKKTRHGRILKRILISVFVLFIFAGIFATYIYNDSLKPVAPDDEDTVNIEVPSGSSNKAIGKILREKDLIRNELVFLIRVRATENTSKLQAGEYKLSPSMGVNEIIDSLVKGGKSGETVKFTIPEGYEIEEIGERLEDEGIVDSVEFLKLTGSKENFEDDFQFLKELDDGQSLEGFLFPSTYEVYTRDSEEEIIEVMLKAFNGVYTKEIKEEIDSVGLNLNELVTFASIIEREARVDKERPMIAGVLYNRLDIDMPLQVDASVQYALKERKERLLYKDLEIDSPYNTYKYKGLPPGPIASPGRASLMAAMNPSDVDYFFYRLKKDGSGEHTFTETFQEHIDAK